MTSWCRIEFDLDLLAQGGTQQLGDIEHRGVDVDIARLQRLPPRKCQQMLDQLAAALGRLIDQFGGLLQRGLVLQAGHQRFGGAGDDGEHVVEIMRDAAGQLADRVEFLRLLQLVLGFARGGDVVIDQRRPADRPCSVMQRAAADHQMHRCIFADRARDDLHIVELVAA